MIGHTEGLIERAVYWKSASHALSRNLVGRLDNDIASCRVKYQGSEDSDSRTDSSATERTD